jgi:putative cell wall-binding protein
MRKYFSIIIVCVLALLMVSPATDQRGYIRPIEF